ncbi:restriction endonuclease subunit S [Pyxidicoccus sp. 3LFB2]
MSAVQGLVSQADYFNRRVASDDLTGYYLLQRGDFAYNKSYSAGFPVGVVRRLDRYPAGVVSPLYICFRPNTARAHSDYLQHFLASRILDDDISWIAKEGVRNHGLLNVGVSDFFSLEFRLPPVSEQCHTAEILNTLDDAIQKTQNLIAKMKQVKQGLMHDLFTFGINDNGELRDPERHPEQFKDSPLGRIPQEWEVTSFGTLCSSSAFGPRFSAAHYADDGSLATLRTTDMDDEGNIDLATMPRAAIEPSTFSPHLLQENDLLISRSGTCGIAAVFPGHDVPVIPGAFLIRFRLIESCKARFYRRYFNSGIGRPHLTRLAVGGVQKNIKGSDVLALPVPHLALREADEIVEVLRSYETAMEHEALKLLKVQLLKVGLSEDLLTGRVRIAPLMELTKP